MEGQVSAGQVDAALALLWLVLVTVSVAVSWLRPGRRRKH